MSIGESEIADMAKKKRMGRPLLPKAEKKRHILAFKLDDTELSALKRKARSLKISVSEAIRQAVKRFAGE